MKRTQFRRDVARAVRTVSKKSGWRASQGCLFREFDDWFVSASPVVALNAASTRGVVRAKPMSIDPLFWEIVGLPENKQQPLSFRLTGAFTCREPTFRETAIEEAENPEAVAARLLELANASLKDLERYSIDQFIDLCRAGGADADSYISAMVPALIVSDRQGEALDACRAARERDSGGGFFFPDGSFCDLAIRWIERRN
ncbi:hypothetical protein [Sphingomicrobium marinum]|uniref:hypothetical protein n=1 Tax=Sphingomicrobium marinum TaxID=1227950 RepID=UPI00223EDB8A|nr:hypothetical protein [Sphingomicrobium marinum]